MANMKKIKEIAKCYNLKVIEDATEALGTKYIDGTFNDAYAGTIGDIGVYSFNGNKIGSLLAHSQGLPSGRIQEGDVADGVYSPVPTDMPPAARSNMPNRISPRRISFSLFILQYTYF